MIQSELIFVIEWDQWVKDNNLKLNHLKTQELVIYSKNTLKSLLPVPVPGISRASSLCILGVNITQYLELTEHIDDVLSRGNRCLFAHKTKKIQVWKVQRLILCVKQSSLLILLMLLQKDVALPLPKTATVFKQC
jgi:hypothetical protein